MPPEVQFAIISHVGMGLSLFATEAEMRSALDRTDDADKAKTDVALVKSAPGLAAFQRLRDAGLPIDATNYDIAAAVVGRDTLSEFTADRDTLVAFMADTIKGQLEGLPSIAKAEVTSGKGTTLDPWIIEYSLAPGAAAAEISAVGTNVNLGTQVANTAGAYEYRQSLSLDDTFDLTLGTATARPSTTASAADLATALVGKQGPATTATVTGLGTEASPWVVTTVATVPAACR